MKDKLLKSLDYLYQLPPSKYTPALVARFKWKLLPNLITFISAADDQPDLDKTAMPEDAEKIFNEG